MKVTATPGRDLAVAEHPASDRGLRWAAGLFAAAVVLHNSDHVRRGADAVDGDVFWLGSAAIVVEVVLVLLVFQRHHLAPLAAAVTGATLAVGYVVVHFLPARAWFSDSFTSASDVSALSWAAATLEVIAALSLAGASLRTLRRQGGLASAAHHRPEQIARAEAAAHPVVMAFALSQVLILAISFAQL